MQPELGISCRFCSRATKEPGLSRIKRKKKEKGEKTQSKKYKCVGKRKGPKKKKKEKKNTPV